MAPKKLKTVISKSKMRLYSQSNVIEATNAVKNHGMNLFRASKMFGIPRTTLYRKITGESPIDSRQGPSPWLGIEAEEEIVHKLLDRINCGFSLKRRNMLDAAQKVVEEKNLKNPFSFNRPGNSWFQGFCNRHPELSQHFIDERRNFDESLPSKRLTEDKLREWNRKVFHYLEKYFNDKELLTEFLNDPRRSFNFVRMNFLFAGKFEGKYLGEGVDYPRLADSSADKENVCLQFAYNASGEVPTPIVGYKFKRMPKSITNLFPRDWHAMNNYNGQIKTDNFLITLKKLVEWCVENSIQFPIILFINHTLENCLGIEVSEYCQQNHIILYLLHPDSIGVIPPKDLDVCYKIKEEWKLYTETQSKEVTEKDITKFDFAPIMHGIIEKIPANFYEQSLAAGGLFPLLEDNVDFTKCIDNLTSTDSNAVPAETIIIESRSILSEAEIAIKKIEEIISDELLRQFMDCFSTGEWIGDVEMQGLFNVWFTLMNEVADNYQESNGASCDVEEIADTDNDEGHPSCSAEDSEDNEDLFCGLQMSVMDSETELEELSDDDSSMSSSRKGGRTVKSEPADEPSKATGKRKAAEKTSSYSKKSKPEDGQDGASGSLKNPTQSQFLNVDYQQSQETQDGKSFNLKISSWNAGGLRALIKKGGLAYVEHESPDILCLQETKCSEVKLPPEAKLDGYHDFWATGAPGSKEGYAGVALYSKKKPLSVAFGLGIPEHDQDGRVITAEFDDFYLINCYTPNSGRGLVTLPKRLMWNKEFLKYLQKLDSKKPLILTGDLNVSHQEIDLARPKSNTRSAGFTQEERDDFTKLLSKGFIDTFRELYPDKKDAYSYWTYMGNARAKNVGWRLDYFVISERLRPNLCDNVMRSEVLGSDHCPIVLTMHM